MDLECRMGSVLEILLQKPNVTEARESRGLWARRDLKRKATIPGLGETQEDTLPRNRFAHSPLSSYVLLQLCQHWILFLGHNGHIYIGDFAAYPLCSQNEARRKKKKALHLSVAF